jgi:hypothetical protein
MRQEMTACKEELEAAKAAVNDNVCAPCGCSAPDWASLLVALRDHVWVQRCCSCRVLTCDVCCRRQASALLSAALPLTVARPKSSGMGGTAPGGKTTLLPPVHEEKYRDVIVRLKKLLDTERLHLQQV